MESRQRIRDLRFRDERWIVSLVAEHDGGDVWRGRILFFRDEPGMATQEADTLTFEALAFDELVAQASAVSVEELTRRLARSLDGGFT